MTITATETAYASGKILQGIKDGVGRITFNNPEKRNAMSLDMWEGLACALQDLQAHPDLRVLVLQWAGGNAFVSGADISQFEENRHNAEASADYARRVSVSNRLLAVFPRPTIAAIRDYCIGGGLQLAMLTDFRMATEGSRFGIPAAKLGIAYGYEGLRNLVSLVGPAQARLLMFTGSQIDATEAYRIGLIERLIPADAFDAAIDETARTIATNAPLAIAAARISIAQSLKDPPDRDMGAVMRKAMECSDSQDFREGRRAFMEKRTPRFNGR